MKTPQKSLSVLICLLSIATLAQKACETTPKNSLNDLNSITVKKCAITSNDNKQGVKNKEIRQIQVKRTRFSKRFLTKRKKSEVTSLVSDINSYGIEKASTEKNTDVLKHKTLIVSKKELSSTIYNFNDVDRIPLFKECKELEESKQKNCFNTKITRFIIDNIEYPEDAYDDDLKGVVSVKFTIKKNGKIDDILVSQSQKGEILQQAVTKLIYKLPKFIPAQKQLQNVATKYEFSLNFSF